MMKKKQWLELLSLKDTLLAREGYFIAEGQFLCQRAYKAGLEIQALFDYRKPQDKEEAPYPVFHLPKEELSQVLGYSFHRGTIALIKRPPGSPLSKMLSNKVKQVLILPHIGDQENLGSLIRSAACLGTELLLIGKASVDPFSRKALRVSMGHIFYLPFFIFSDNQSLVDNLKNQGFSIVIADSNETSSLLINFSFPPKCALVMGEEAFGPQKIWSAQAHDHIKIPMSDQADSLNVAVSAGIILYQWNRNTRLKP